MTEKNKLLIFRRGNLIDCYLNLPLEECKRRDAEKEKNKSPLQLDDEKNMPLEIQEQVFDDHFELWVFTGDELNELANKMLKANIGEI